MQEEGLSKHLSAFAKAAPTRVKRHKKLNVPMTDHKIKLIFNITGERSQNSLLLNFLKKINIPVYLLHSARLCIQFKMPAGDADNSFLETLVASFCTLPALCFKMSSLSVEL